MNIAVLTSEKRTVVRPDTTRVKDGEDVWIPDFISEMLWSPVLYARICKSGKCVDGRFAPRYYDAVNAGVLLYPRELMEDGPEGYAQAICLDHSSVLRMKFSEENLSLRGTARVDVTRDGKDIFSSDIDIDTLVQDAIATVSERCWLRIGDFVAVELIRPETVCRRGEPAPRLKGLLGGMEAFDFKIVL